MTFERNVNVNGGTFNQVNYPVVIKGNLAITGSAGVNGYNGFFAPYTYGDFLQSEVYGNFSYTGNSAGPSMFAARTLPVVEVVAHPAISLATASGTARS